MEQLPAFGTAIAGIVRPTLGTYVPLLQKNAAAIRSTPKKSFTYGVDARQQLDVYYPSSNPTGVGCPILIFLYGGGLVNGARVLPMVGDGLAYTNLGHFFAEKCGFVVVIIDYRLVPQAKFPSGGEDLAMAADWVGSNMKEFGGGDKPRNLFIMGNSAGGVHVSTYLFSPVFAESRKHILGQGNNHALRLRGVIFLSVPMHFNAAASNRTEVLTAYYSDRVNEDCPVGLLKTWKESGNGSETLPGVGFLMLTGSLDPEDEILVTNKDFIDVWNAGNSSDASTLQIEVMEGHNHISPALALATDDPKEEAWGFQVAKFCTSRMTK